MWPYVGRHRLTQKNGQSWSHMVESFYSSIPICHMCGPGVHERLQVSFKLIIAGYVRKITSWITARHPILLLDITLANVLRVDGGDALVAEDAREVRCEEHDHLNLVGLEVASGWPEQQGATVTTVALYLSS